MNREHDHGKRYAALLRAVAGIPAAAGAVTLCVACVLVFAACFLMPAPFGLLLGAAAACGIAGFIGGLLRGRSITEENDLHILLRTLDYYPSPIILFPADGDPVRFNGSWYQTTGLAAGGGSRWQDALVPEDRERIDGIVSDAIASRQPINTELRLRLADGSLSWMAGVGKTILDPRGGDVGYMVIFFDVNDQKALFDQIRLEAQLLDAITDPVVLHDFQGNIDYINKSATDLCTCDAAPHDGSQCQREPSARCQWLFDEHVDELLSSGKTRFEVSLAQRDGPARHFEIRSRLIETGGKTLVLSIGRDVTERTVAAEALEGERDRARRYFEMAGTMLVVFNADQTVRRINAMGCRILGHAEKEIVGRNWFDAFTPDDERERLRKMFTGMTGDGLALPENVESVLVTASGERRIISWRAIVLRDARGAITGVLGSGEDITDRRRSEELLRESEAKYTALVEQAKDGVVILQDGAFRFTNRALTEITGFSAKEILGMRFLDLVPDEHREQFRGRYELRRAHAAVPPVYESVFRCRDGTTKEVEVSIGDIQYHGRAAEVGVIRDITERRKLQHRLIQTEKISSLSLFTAGVAHEFNNILNIIQGYAQILELFSEDPHQVHDSREGISKQVFRGKDLVQQLGNLRENGAAERREARVGYLAGEIVKLMRSMYHKHGIAFKVNAAGEYTARIDTGGLQSVLTNLLQNAVHAMLRTGGIITVDILRKGGAVEIAVRDQGKGIPEKDQGKIFTPFYTTKGSLGGELIDKAHGTGLGLWMSSNIVRECGGSLRFESFEGKGTVFFLTLPLLREESSPVPEQAPAGRAEARGGRHVLIVDDERDMGETLRRSLECKGYPAAYCDDVLSAVAYCRVHSPDVVFLDCVMPGAEVGDLLRQMAAPSRRIVILTGKLLEKGEEEELLLQGACAVLHKPVALEEILFLLAALPF